MIARRAFTAVELAGTIAVIAILSGITIPALLPTLARARVNQAAAAVEQVARQARLLAMTRLTDSDYFGVVLARDDAGRSYVALTRGQTATPAQIWMTAAGNPVARIDLNPNVVPWKDGSVLTGSVGWLFQYRTGCPVTDPSTAALPVSVGVPGSPVASSLGMRSLDDRYRTDIAFYKVGLMARDEVRVAEAP